MTGVNGQDCGLETVVASAAGLLGHKEYVFASTEMEYSQKTSDFKKYFDITDPTDDKSCSTLTYTLLGTTGLENIDTDFSIADGNLKVVITQAFEPKAVTLKATTAGGSATASITLTYGVVNQGCTYSQTGTTTYSKYFNPALPSSFNWKTDFPCQYSSDNDKATDCPLTKLVNYTDVNGLAAGATAIDYEDQIFLANNKTAGDKMTYYYAAGLLGDRFLDSVLVSSDTVCQFSYYACGLETIAAKEDGALEVKRGKTSGATYIMDETTLSNLFSIDTTAAKAYDGCKNITYELVTDDLVTAFVDTTYVSYETGTGLTWDLKQAVSEESFYLKATTIGGVSATKQLKFTVILCGTESIALKAGVTNLAYGAEKLAGGIIKFDEESSKIYFTVSDASDPVCKFLTYRLTSSNNRYFTQTNVKITNGYLNIHHSTNWGIVWPRLYAKTPGGKETYVPTTLIAANTDCIYTLGNTASQDFYVNPSTDLSIDYGSSSYKCQWTSSNSADTQCTNKFTMIYSSNEGNSGDITQYIRNAAPFTIANGTHDAGFLLSHYRAMGIPGNSSAGKHIVRGDICTENYYMCGMETVTLVDTAAYVIKRAKKTSGTTTFVMNNATLAEFFKIDYSAATAYSGCTAETYSLVQSDGTTPYTSTKYVTIKATTGLTWKLWTAVEEEQFFVKMTTKGGVSAVKPINFTIRACGSETIATTNNYIPHWETIYATGIKGDSYKISAKNLSSYFNVTDTTEVCSDLTYKLVGNGGWPVSSPIYTIDSDSNFSILIQNPFDHNTNIFLRATTPGNKQAKVKFLIRVFNQGCTYSFSGESTELKYYKPSDKVSYDFTKSVCNYTSTNTEVLHCPLYKIQVTDAKGATFADQNISMLSTKLNFAANEFEAGGFPGSIFYKVGLYGNPFKNELLTDAGQVCTATPHFCGLETITEASTSAKKLSYKKSTTDVTTVKITKSDIEKWFTVDISAFDANAKGANWTGCVERTYALLASNNKTAYSNSSRATFNTTEISLTIITSEIAEYTMYLKATTVGGISFSKKIEVEIKNNCVASIFSATSTPAMTNNLTVGSDSYQIYERVAYIGAKSSTLTANFSTDVAFTTTFPIDCPIATWSIKSSLTATTSLSSGTAYATDAATQKFATDSPAIHNYFYTVSTKDPVSKTINYKIAVCGLEKVAVNDTTELKITKYYNEFKKDYEDSKYFAESIYSAWFSLNTTTLVSEKLVADTVEADMFKNGCPINDYILCKDTDCLEAHAETSLFYLDYQTKTQITSNGTLNADGTEPAAATRRILATAPTIPYTYDAFNITKVSTRNTTELYSRIVMKIDTIYAPQTAYLAAITTGYAMGGRNITFENKCGLEYVYPSKTQYDFQLQAENGFYTIQATDYQNWFKSTFTACPIIKYEIRSFASTVKVDNKLADGTYLKFTDEYLAAQGVTDTKIPSVKASSQLVDGLAYTFCHNSLTDAGVACTSAKQGGYTLSQYSFGPDDIMQRVEILSTGQLQINTDGVVVDEDKTNIYAVDIVAISEGGAEGFAHIKLEFIAKRQAANNPPAFASTPPDVTINKVDDTAQVYTSPSASDMDGDTVTISVSGNIYDFISIQTSDTNFLLNIDHSKITEDLDGKSFTLKVELTDGKDTTKYEVKGQINWKVPEPEPIPEPVVEEEAVVEVPEEQKMALQEGEVEIGAAVAEWQDVASPELMNALFAEIKPPPPPPIDPKKPKKKKKAVKVKESPITRNGKFPVKFNQKMKIPGFLDTGSPEGSRLLANGQAKIPLSQLDVGRDVFNVRFILASEIDPKDIKYFLQIDKWDDSGIEIFLNFTEPMLLSRGDDRDFAEITVKRPQLFISEETGEMIDTSSLVFYQTLPRQLPTGVEEKSMKDDAGSIGKGMESMAYVQIGLQFVIKGIMADLMTTFYCLQLCCFFTIYKVKIPGNSEIYIDEFRKLINMDAAKPDNILKQIDEEYSIDYFMNLSKERISSAAESSGMQTSNFAKNMSTYLFIGTCIFFGIIFMAALTCLKSKFQALIKEKLNQTINKIFFNGQIKAQTVAYLATAIAFSTSMQYMDFENKTSGELWAEVGIPIVIVGLYPFICLFVLLKFRPHLAKPRFRKKIGNMYEGVHLTRNKYTILFYPMYLFRRAVFVCIPIMFWFESAFQVQILFFMNYGFSIYFFGVQPIADPLKNKMQAFNEGMMLAITYHMFYFTDFANVKYQFIMGYSFVFTLCAILFVNIFKMLHNTFEGWLSERRKMANQKAYEKAYNDWVFIQINGKRLRKEAREKARLEKIERAKKAMQMFKDSDLITKLKADILKRQEEKKKQDSMANIKNALGGFFNKNSTKDGGKGNAMAALFAKKPDSPKIKQNPKMNMLQLSLKKKLDLTKINETAGEDGTARGIFDPIKEQKKKERVDAAKNEFDLAFKNLFAKNESDSEEVELTEEDIELNKLIASLSFLDRNNYRKNIGLVKKLIKMDKQVADKRWGSDLSLEETIDLMNTINEENKMILPIDAIRFQHRKIIGQNQPEENALGTAEDWFNIFQDAIQIEIQRIKMQQDKIELKNKVGKYHYLKEEEKKVEENVFDLDALDQELAYGQPVQDEDSDIDIELPEKLRNKKKNQVGLFATGAAVIGTGTVVKDNLDDSRNDDAGDALSEGRVEDEEGPDGEGSAVPGFGFAMAKMKYIGASGLVFAGILEKEDLPPDPSEEEKKEKAEEEKEEVLEDEDSASDDEDGEVDLDDEGGRGKKKKKRGGVVDMEQEEEEEDVPDDY